MIRMYAKIFILFFFNSVFSNKKCPFLGLILIPIITIQYENLLNLEKLNKMLTLLLINSLTLHYFKGGT